MYMYCEMRAYHTEYYYAEVGSSLKKLSSKNISSLGPSMLHSVSKLTFNTFAMIL